MSENNQQVPTENGRDPADFTGPVIGPPAAALRAARMQIAAAGPAFAGAAPPVPGIRVIDISRWQPPVGIDYDRLCDPDSPDRIDAVVLKISEAEFADPAFADHWPEFYQRGMPVMGYHFFRSNLDGTGQADFCLETAQPLIAAQGGTAIFCDIETADGTANSTRIQRVSAFLNRVATGGQEAGIYSSPALWQVLMTPTPSWVNNFWLWIAHWTGAAFPNLPGGWDWSKVVLWQQGIWDDFNWCLPVPGMQPDVDVNAGYFADRPAVYTFFGGAPPVPDPPPDPPPPGNCDIQMVVSVNVLNVRSGPGINFPVQYQNPIGTEVSVVRIDVNNHNVWGQLADGNWSAIVFEGGTYMRNA